MFRLLNSVETVVSLFQPPKKRDTIKVDVDVSSMEPTITETQHLATYEEIKKYCKEVHGLKVSTLFISQVKHFHGLEMRRNYNTSKNSEYTRTKCPANKFHAIEDALRHFKMI